MRKVFWVTDCIVSSLGETTDENYSNIFSGVTGVSEQNGNYVALGKRVDGGEDMTSFEALTAKTMHGALENITLPPARTLFLLSTTKGNIELIDETVDARRISLHDTASSIAKKFGFDHFNVVSNACISGVLAIITAKRLIQSGLFDHAVIAGSDVVTEFVLSGFRSLQALSNGVCKPFDANRDGINLGESCGVVILSSSPESLGGTKQIAVLGEGVTNDANHISGPSRTGEELAFAIRSALNRSDLQVENIDFISAHGTGTVYNDEMEAKAFHLAGLSNTPLHSLKGYYGHTLGAAGILESIIAVRQLQRNEAIATKGFERLGVSHPVRVACKSEATPMKRILKTASGFGGCNAAIIFEKQFD